MGHGYGSGWVWAMDRVMVRGIGHDIGQFMVQFVDRVMRHFMDQAMEGHGSRHGSGHELENGSGYD